MTKDNAIKLFEDRQVRSVDGKMRLKDVADWDKGNGEDNYTEMVKNVSRNFNDKKAMRDVVVNKEYCRPLVPHG